MMVVPLFPNSQAAVQQTLARLETVTGYLSQLSSSDLTAHETANAFVLEEVRFQSELAETPIDGHALQLFRRLAHSEPWVRSALQAATERMERAIGTSLPLRFSVHAGSTLPERGIAIYLGDLEGMPTAPASLQAFSLPGSSPASSPRSPLPARLSPKSHSEAVREHFARSDIELLGQWNLTGTRVVPLSSPAQGEIGATLTRIGRLTFLGLTEDHLDDLGRYDRQADIVLLSGALAMNRGFIDRAVQALHPRMILHASSEPTGVANHRDTTVVSVSSAEPMAIEFHPFAQTLELDLPSGAGQQIALKRHERILDILENLREPVSIDLLKRISGTMTAPSAGQRAQGAWRWAKLTMNGAVSMALRYLLLLDFDPNGYTRVQDREEALMRVIDEMTGKMKIRDSVPDHVWAFKELLIRCGLLTPRG